MLGIRNYSFIVDRDQNQTLMHRMMLSLLSSTENSPTTARYRSEFFFSRLARTRGLQGEA